MTDRVKALEAAGITGNVVGAESVDRWSVFVCVEGGVALRSLQHTAAVVAT